jgi:predicted transcriptional regulator
MGRAPTLVQLSDHLIELLDERATERGISRSQLIREAIELLFENSVRTKIDEAIVEGYTRIPQAGDGLQGFRDHAASATSRRMAQEGEW